MISFLIFVKVAAASTFTLILSRQNILYKCPQNQFANGCAKDVITINGSTPGPTLRFKKGELVKVTVVNEIYDDYSTVHWHGMSQRNTPYNDGVPGLSQCVIPNINGQNTMIYEFTPESAGTFWYHGHYNQQDTDGLYGVVIVYSDDEKAQFAAAGAPYVHD
jgi:hypothetical protein